MTTVNRKDIRTALQTALTTAITKANFVERYLADPQGKMPAVTLAVRGSGGNPLTADADALRHKFMVHLLVVKGKGTAYTNEDAEDLLDDVRNELDGWIEANTFQVSTLIFTVERDGDSEVVPVTIGNEQYLDEAVPILVRTFYP